MATDSFPITQGLFEFRDTQGRIFRLQNQELYHLLLQLWKRVAAGATAESVAALAASLGVVEEQIAEAGDDLVSESLQLQNQIDQLGQTDMNNVEEAQGLSLDNNTMLAAVGDAAFQEI